MAENRYQRHQADHERNSQNEGQNKQSDSSCKDNLVIRYMH